MRRPSAITIGVVVLLIGAVALVALTGLPGVAVDDEAAPHHLDPSEYTGDGDSDALADWLGAWMDERLSSSLIEISGGQADTAREMLGEEYTERLGQYAEVTGDTERAGAYQEARDDHERLADLMQEYNETWAAYEAALEEGDGEQARALAREINELADEIEAISDRILDRVEIVPLEPAAIDAVTENKHTVSNESEQVRQAHFTETQLTLEAVDEPVSFLEPAEISGMLETAEGEAIANEVIELDAAGTSVTVETDGDGAFSFEYRPVDLPVGDATLQVSYVPDPTSTYLGSVATVDLEVEQVQPSLTMDLDQTEAGYADEVEVSGTLVVEDRPVDGVELDILLDGVVLDSTTVDAGEFTTEVTIPASVEAGDTAIEVRLPFEEQALAGVGVDEEIEILETETDLTVEASVSEDESEIEVVGELTTEGGQPIADQPVLLHLDDGSPVSVETDADGNFETVLSIPDGASDNVTITATFDGAGTNLVGAEAETVVQLDGTTGLSLLWPALVGALLLIGIGLAGWWYRRDGSTDEPALTEPSSDGQTPTTRITRDTDAHAILDAAIERYTEEDFDAAVVLGYGAMRAHLAGEVDTDESYTHWEFLDAIRAVARQNGMSETQVAQLADATDAFERASFDPRGVDVDAATEVIDSGRDIVQ